MSKQSELRATAEALGADMDLAGTLGEAFCVLAITRGASPETGVLAALMLREFMRDNPIRTVDFDALDSLAKEASSSFNKATGN